MIPWTKMPSIVGELRIAWVIPELRPLIRRIIVLRIARWAMLPFQLALSIPLALAAMIGGALVAFAERGIDPVWRPSNALYKRQQANVDKSFEIVSRDEIRRRAFGEEAVILPKGTPLDDIMSEANNDPETTG